MPAEFDPVLTDRDAPFKITVHGNKKLSLAAMRAWGRENGRGKFRAQMRTRAPEHRPEDFYWRVTFTDRDTAFWFKMYLG
jgi:hypothetical protein